MIDAHHVAHRIDAHLVEAAVAHPALQLHLAGLVRRGEIGDGELALFGVAGVAVAGEEFGAVPHLVAEHGLEAELVGQPHLGDAVDVAQALGELEVRVVLEPAREGGDDLGAREPAAARPAHGEDEGPAEARVVVGVELLDAREFGGRAVRQARRGLLVGRFGGERLADHRLAGQLRVGADQRELRLAAGFGQHLHQRMLELRQRLERPALQRTLGDPGRVLVQAVEPTRGILRARRIELFQRDGHALAS